MLQCVVARASNSFGIPILVVGERYRYLWLEHFASTLDISRNILGAPPMLSGVKIATKIKNKLRKKSA